MTIGRLSRRGVLLTVLAAPVVTACAPSTPDTDSWRLHARRAVSDVLSSLQTARLALEQALDGHLYDAYLETVTVDAEEAGSAAAAKLAAEQPPVPERRRYTVVTGHLDDATSLLADARIAAVDGRTGEYPRLIERLHSTAARLDTVEQDLHRAPRSRP